MPQMKEK